MVKGKRFRKDLSKNVIHLEGGWSMGHIARGGDAARYSLKMQISLHLNS